MGELNKEAKGTLTAGDLELIREAIEEARAGAARKRKLQLVWIYLTIVVTLTCSAWWTTRKIDNAMAPVNQVLNGPVGHPELGLIMDVNFITGYRDSGGNYVEGSLDRLNHKVDKVCYEKN
ncbi:hypothetical protein [Stenotrophomonas maltophilia]|uniref:hypothetical protein n=1 Tax=Stenotrophomonas maltophilia TaxID=40324 RepID=UPI0013FE49A7|nr:hypothetical protein [Stenotrophomonas maltophilia]